MHHLIGKPVRNKLLGERKGRCGTILKCVLKKLDWLGMGIGDDEELSGSIKGVKFLDQLLFASQERFSSMEFYLTMALQPLWALAAFSIS
jgi:hypothetical protein